MKAVCRRAGIPFVPPHQAGRHSFASNALAMGATAKEVMEAGGWKTARMVLETYAHANEAGRSIADRFDAELAQPGTEISQVTDKKGAICGHALAKVGVEGSNPFARSNSHKTSKMLSRDSN